MDCLRPKYIILDLKKYKGVTFDDTEYWCTIWGKIDSYFQKCHEEFGKFLLEDLKVSKSGLWWDPFIQSGVCIYELKIYKGLMCHENEEWCKIWRGIGLPAQNWHEEFEELWPKHLEISSICFLMGCFWPKYIMLELKKHKGVMFDGTEYWCSKRKLTCAFKNDMENLAHFQRLKNNDFILERKTEELNKNKNSKQPDRPSTVCKLYFTVKINE